MYIQHFQCRLDRNTHRGAPLHFPRFKIQNEEREVEVEGTEGIKMKLAGDMIFENNNRPSVSLLNEAKERER